MKINQFISGYGKFHTNNPLMRGKPYFSETLPIISLGEIEGMLSNPQQLDKEKARWIVFSNLQSREHKAQRESGLYGALWCDIDETTIPINELSERLETITGGCLAYVYTSKSSTPGKPKYRGIIPLAESLTGLEYIVYQSILSDKLTALNITPDKAAERAAQPCYLPNKGDDYHYRIISGEGELLTPEAWRYEYDVKLQQLAAKEKAQAARRQQAEIKREALAAQGLSVFEAVNRSYTINLCLRTYDYQANGTRWLSPLSQSGAAAVIIKNNKWISHHGSDINAGIGQVAEDGNSCFGDAFDLMVFYEYGNDRTAALKSLGDRITTNSGQTINEANQQAYATQKGDEDTLQMFTKTAASEPFYKPKLDLAMYSLKGQSKEMEAQMLEDKFVLGEFALLGQATAFYAQPNAGKTLMTLWLLIQAIKENSIKSEDVYYINADDNHKGLVTKLKLAEANNFDMLVPSYNNFHANDFLLHIKTLIKEQSAKGKIIILDTLKKFTDVMDKKIGTEFGKVIREFISNGGTVIMLAHVNKHRDSDDKLIYSGTSDIVDDIDCAYTLDTSDKDYTGRKVVTFENFKSRGDVTAKKSYSYLVQAGLTYNEILESIEQVDEANAAKAILQKQVNDKLEKNEIIIQSITEFIKNGVITKTELVEEVRNNTGESLKKVHAVLRDHDGKDYIRGDRWRETKGDKNTRVYMPTTFFCSSDEVNEYKQAKGR